MQRKKRSSVDKPGAGTKKEDYALKQDNEPNIGM
jgi:hypothetical protein